MVKDDRDAILLSLDKSDNFIQDISRILEQLSSLIPNDVGSQATFERLWNKLRTHCFGLSKASMTFETELLVYCNYDPQWKNILNVRRRLVDSLGSIILSGSAKQFNLWMLAWKSTQDKLDLEMIEVRKTLLNQCEYNKNCMTVDDCIPSQKLNDNPFSKTTDATPDVMMGNDNTDGSPAEAPSLSSSNPFSSSASLFPY